MVHQVAAHVGRDHSEPEEAAIVALGHGLAHLQRVADCWHTTVPLGQRRQHVGHVRAGTRQNEVEQPVRGKLVALAGHAVVVEDLQLALALVEFAQVALEAPGASRHIRPNLRRSANTIDAISPRRPTDHFKSDTGVHFVHGHGKVVGNVLHL